jgi:VIT1/CCC1 family predicted Fe2+/Mn2+ transporter
MHNTVLALRVSQTIAVVMLFMTGYAYGRISRYHPWSTGVAMVLLGVALVGIAMALGG